MDKKMKLTKKPINKPVMLFGEFVGQNPTLYDGVNLDKATIDYINNYFYEYKVVTATFEQRFLNKLRKSVGIYNNLKGIELNEKVFDITTNVNLKDTTLKTIDRLKRNTILDKSGDTTTYDTGTTTTTDNNQYTPATNVRTATRVVPMNSKGSFDELFEWEEHGATEVTESKNNGQTDKTVDVSVTDDDTQSKTVLNTKDTEYLKSLNDIANLGKEQSKGINSQAVKLIENIWNYLITPKAIDYLIDSLEPSFLLVI